MTIRKYTKVAIASILLVAPILNAEAQNYPQKEVTLVVGSVPGGFTDRLGRMLADKLSARFKKPVIVDNRAGAAGLIGAEYVMRSTPNGLTLLLQTSDSFVKSLETDRIDPIRNFTNIATLATQPVTLSVGSQVPVNSLAEFVQLAKSKPGEISYASNGQGGATHLGMEIFAKQAGIRLLHVPYRGAAGAVTDLLSGNVQSILLSVQGLKPYFDAGKVRGLAITTPQRSPSVPMIQTFTEAGYPDFQVRLWYVLSGPKGIPDSVVNQLNKEVGEILAQPEFSQSLTVSAADPLISSPQETSVFMEKEFARWNPVVKAHQ